MFDQGHKSDVDRSKMKSESVLERCIRGAIERRFQAVIDISFQLDTLEIKMGGFVESCQLSNEIEVYVKKNFSDINIRNNILVATQMVF